MKKKYRFYKVKGDTANTCETNFNNQKRILLRLTDDDMIPWKGKDKIEPTCHHHLCETRMLPAGLSPEVERV